MQTNILPRTFRAGLPHVVVTSTSGSERPIDATALKVFPRDTRLVINHHHHHRVDVMFAPERGTQLVIEA
jgi:hypothetical protein